MAQPLLYSRIQTLEESLAYFLNCELATIEHFQMLKKPPKGEFRRHQSIARAMVVQGLRFNVDLTLCSRVGRFLEGGRTKEEALVEALKRYMDCTSLKELYEKDAAR